MVIKKIGDDEYCSSKQFFSVGSSADCHVHHSYTEVKNEHIFILGEG